MTNEERIQRMVAAFKAEWEKGYDEITIPTGYNFEIAIMEYEKKQYPRKVDQAFQDMVTLMFRALVQEIQENGLFSKGPIEITEATVKNLKVTESIKVG